MADVLSAGMLRWVLSVMPALDVRPGAWTFGAQASSLAPQAQGRIEEGCCLRSVENSMRG